LRVAVEVIRGSGDIRKQIRSILTDGTYGGGNGAARLSFFDDATKLPFVIDEDYGDKINRPDTRAWSLDIHTF